MKIKYSIDFAKSNIEKFIKVDTIFHIGSGNHSDAFVVNDNIVVKFPKHNTANNCLIKEINVLQALENKLSLNIPNVEFWGTFKTNNQEFTFFASKKLKGKNLSRSEFLNLPTNILDINAKIIADFLIELHNQKNILNIKRKDLFLLHGDFSLNHCLFDENNLICSILDFGDCRVGKYKSDFVYLLDNEDGEEFGFEFGNKVFELYNKLRTKKTKEIIKNDDIFIRELEDYDKSLLLKWLTDERVLNFWEGKNVIFDMNRIIEDYYTEEDVEVIRTIIEYCGKSIGYAHMYKLSEELLNEYEYPLTEKVVYGIDQFIGEPEFWNKGIGTNFMKLILKFLVEEKNAEIVILDPHSDNPRAIRCYEKVGFKKIKFLPKHELHDGKMVDCYLMEYKPI